MNRAINGAMNQMNRVLSLVLLAGMFPAASLAWPALPVPPALSEVEGSAAEGSVAEGGLSDPRMLRSRCSTARVSASGGM